MSIPLIIRPEAEEDIKDAFSWYESQRTGLGIELVRCIDAAFGSVVNDPELYGILYRNIRRILVRRFPYGVFFTLGKNKIVILAVMHVKRHPRRWQNRS
jgi:toxin ParE1/3/4